VDWKSFTSHVILLNDLEDELNILIPQHWYILQKKHIIKLSGFYFLSTFYNNSPSTFLKILQPEHTFLPWKFSITPKGTWKTKETQKSFFNFLLQELSIKHHQDWYHLLSNANIHKYGGGGMLQIFYRDSPIEFLQKMVPNHDWMLWKFKCTPRDFWNSIHSQVAYFSWLCGELLLTHPQSFYSLTLVDFKKNYGSRITRIYRDSTQAIVTELNPEMKWSRWLFRRNRKWENMHNHKKYFDWVGEEMGFEKKEDWNKLKKDRKSVV